MYEFDAVGWLLSPSWDGAGVAPLPAFLVPAVEPQVRATEYFVHTPYMCVLNKHAHWRVTRTPTGDVIGKVRGNYGVIRTAPCSSQFT